MESMVDCHKGRSYGAAERRWLSILLTTAVIVDTVH
jgi:hypothetical protein